MLWTLTRISFIEEGGTWGVKKSGQLQLINYIIVKTLDDIIISQGFPFRGVDGL